MRAGAAFLLVVAACDTAHAGWLDWPAGPRDWQLESLVRAAYEGAAGYAHAHGNYFSRDEDFGGLRAAVAGALLDAGLSDVSVVAVPAADADALNACAKNATELRFAVTAFGDGIWLAAASAARVFSYRYDPHEDGAILVTPAAPCGGVR